MPASFQFSLGKMLRATAWFAVACAAVVGMQRTQNDDLLRDVDRTRMLAYAALALVSGILAVATLGGAERAGRLLAFWILVLLAATLAFFVVIYGSDRRLRLRASKEVNQMSVSASTPSPALPSRGRGPEGSRFVQWRAMGWLQGFRSSGSLPSEGRVGEGGRRSV